MKKKLILRSLIGAPVGLTIGIIITIIISLCTGHGEYYPTAHELMESCGNWINAVLVQTSCTLLLGAAFGAASVVWEIEKWSILKQTLVHFAAFSASFFPLAFVMYWIPHNIYGALGYIGGFIAGYAIMWASIYFSAKAKVKKINDKLDKENEINNTEN